MPVESLFVMLLVGLIAGWLAGTFVTDGAFGLVGSIAIGVVGAFIGGLLLPATGETRIGTGLVTAIRQRHDWCHGAPAPPATAQAGLTNVVVPTAEGCGYEAMSRRPINVSMLARTGSKKRSETRLAKWLPM